MRNEKENLIDIVRTNIKELQEGMDRHCALLDAIVTEKPLGGDHIDNLVAQCPARHREEQLVTAIRAAIDVLEESRKSFKSKRLEGLRKDLTRVLIDLG
ncbi:hypothetical protein [Desulfoplanes sp.]